MQLYSIRSEGSFIDSQHHASLWQTDKPDNQVDKSDNQTDKSDNQTDKSDNQTDKSDKQHKKYLLVNTTTEPRDPSHGYRHGAAPDSLVLLGEKQNGISNHQFDIVPTHLGQLLIRNMSQYGTIFEHGDTQIKLLNIGASWAIEDNTRNITITDPIMLHIHFFERPHVEWKAFCAKLSAEIPLMDNLQLKSTTNCTAAPALPRKRHGDTIPIPATQLKKGRIDPSAPAPLIMNLDTSHLSCRILIQPEDQAMHSRSGTWEELRRTDDGVFEPIHCLTFRQTAKDTRTHVELEVPFRCRFQYFWFQDSLLFFNLSGSSLKLTVLDETSYEEILGDTRDTTLEPGFWRVSDRNNRGFQLRIFPRQYSVRLTGPKPEFAPNRLRRLERAKLEEGENLEVKSTQWPGQWSRFRLGSLIHRHNLFVLYGATFASHATIGERTCLIMVFQSTRRSIRNAARLLEKEQDLTAGKDGERQIDGLLMPIGGDARLGILEFAYVSPPTTLTCAKWSEKGYFKGSQEDAEKVLRGLTKPLATLAAHRRTCNSIVPWRIFYDRQKGTIMTGVGRITSNFGKRDDTDLEEIPWSPEKFEYTHDDMLDSWNLGALGLYLFGLMPLSEWGRWDPAESLDLATKTWTDVPFWGHVARLLERDPKRRLSIIQFYCATTDHFPNSDSALSRCIDQQSNLRQTQIDDRRARISRWPPPYWGRLAC